MNKRLFLFVSFVCFVVSLHGASPDIRVRVQDFTLAITPGSRTVTLTPIESGTVRTGTSDSNGIVTLSAVVPKDYAFTISGSDVALTLRVPESHAVLEARDLIVSAWTPPTPAGSSGASANLQAWSLLGTDPLALPGALKLSGETNELTVSAGSLLLDGAAITGGGDTVWTNDANVGEINLVPTNNFPIHVINANNNAEIILKVLPGPEIRLGIGSAGFDWYGFVDGPISKSALAISSEVGYGAALLIDPDGDNGAVGFHFSTGASNTLGTNILARFQDNHVDAMTLSGNGRITLAGTTNQITFGGTNTAPVSAVAPAKWISVQVSGLPGAYRLPLYE